MTDSAGRRIWRWQTTNLTIDTTTSRRIRFVETAEKSIQISNFRTWEEVGRWYASLERDRETVTPAIRAKADSLIRGSRTLRDSIDALYRYVSSQFRYVSLSFGVGRYRPRSE